MDIWKIVRIALLCLFVGFILRSCDWTPMEIWDWMIISAEDAIYWIRDFLEWAGPNILLGAVVVLPILGISWLLKKR